MDDTGQVVSDNEVSDKKSKKDIISVDDLKKMMNEAIENEEYELAAELRDRISKIESE